MDKTFIFWISSLIVLLGIASIVLIYYFGQKIYSAKYDRILNSWYDYIDSKSPRVTEISNFLSNFLERRNEFWTTFGQVLVAILIIIVLSILLLTRSISAEAGLPILSAISGFAIAKGVSGSKSLNIPEKFNE